MTAKVPASRDVAAALVMQALTAACPTGEVCLIGSMARAGEADAFSDIDLRWTISQGQASAPLQSLRHDLQQMAEVESLRVDPEVRPDELLVFVRFVAWPLWWRVDLEIHSAGLESMDVPGADRWSPQESACMGVIVTLKALARDRPEAAERLFALALQRVHATDAPGDWQQRIGSLLNQLEAGSPPTADLVPRTRRLTDDLFSSGRVPESRR